MGRHASGNVIVDKVKYPQKNGWTYLYERKRILVPETKKYKLLNKTPLYSFRPYGQTPGAEYFVNGT